jgi:FG-GAP-like repeat
MLKKLFLWKHWLCCFGLIACLTTGFACFSRSSRPLDFGDKDELPLDKVDREFLWECEHRGQLLSQRGFDQFGKALSKADAVALRRLLADDFQGSTLRQPREIRLPGAYAEVVREEEAPGKTPEVLSSDAFVSRLLQYRKIFSQAPKVKLSLKAFSPQNRDAMDGGWKGTCVLRMYGETTPNAPAEITLDLSYQVPRPSEELFKGTGWLQRCAITQTLVCKAPRPLLREVAAERGIDRRLFHDNWTCSPDKPKSSQTGGVYLCDYDRDGILDMLVVDLNGRFLFKGLPGGKFKDVTAAVGLSRTGSPAASFAAAETGPVAFADLDGDGWDDLIFGGNIYQNQPDGQGGRRFVDVTSKVKGLRLRGNVNQVTIVDFDRDGRLDIYGSSPGSPKVGSWTTGTSGDSSSNHLWRNLGNWEFEDVTEAAGVGGGNRSCFSAVWLDANNDGWPDVYVINEFGKGVLLLNNGNGTFREQLLCRGPGDFGSMGVVAGDVNNDGNIDLYIGNMYSKAGTRVIGNLRPDAYDPDLMETIRHFVKGSQLWLNKGQHEGQVKFEPKGKDWQVHSVGWAYGAALVDLDNDGFLDLYATAGFMSMDRTEPDG